MVRQDFCMKHPHWSPWLALLLALVALVSHAATAGIPYEGSKLAPEFPADIEWLNTDKPITLKSLKGKIVLLDFWTYCCINCMHVIPDLKKLEAKYPRELVVIGVHSWPTLVLINPNGRVIGYLSGEGIYEPFDRIIGETIAHFDAKHEIDRAPFSRKLERAKSPRSLFAYPGKIAADERSRRIFFSDSNHNRLIIASLDGEILDCIGEGEIGLRDGDLASARFYRPQGLCLDPQKNLLYVADTENHAVRKVDLNRKSVETLAGTGRQARRPNLEGAGRNVDLNSPWDLSLVGGMLYIAMAGTHQLWSLDLKTLQAKIYAGSGREDITDGPLLEAALAQPSGITTDGQRLYFADSEASAVRTIDLQAGGQVLTLIGEGLFKFGDVDGKYPEARLQHCIGVAWHDGFVYVADTYNHKIRRLDPRTKELTTFIGTGQPGMTDGERTAARLNEPNGLCFERH